MYDRFIGTVRHPRNKLINQSIILNDKWLDHRSE